MRGVHRHVVRAGDLDARGMVALVPIVIIVIRRLVLVVVVIGRAMGISGDHTQN